MQVIAEEQLAHKSHDNEGFIMFGSIPVQMKKKNVKNYSLLMSPSCIPFADKHPELKSNSSHLSDLTSSQNAPTGFEHRKCKRRARIDLGLNQASGNNCSVPSSNLEHKGLPLTKEFSTANLTKPQDKSPQGCDSWKKKDASVNRRPYNSPNNSNYARSGNMFEASVSTPEVKPYDICFRGRRNSVFVGSALHEENNKSYIEMHEGETKEGLILRPGMVLLKNFIGHDEQVLHFSLASNQDTNFSNFFDVIYVANVDIKIYTHDEYYLQQANNYCYQVFELVADFDSR